MSIDNDELNQHIRDGLDAIAVRPLHEDFDERVLSAMRRRPWYQRLPSFVPAAAVALACAAILIALAVLAVHIGAQSPIARVPIDTPAPAGTLAGPGGLFSPVPGNPAPPAKADAPHYSGILGGR